MNDQSIFSVITPRDWAMPPLPEPIMVPPGTYDTAALVRYLFDRTQPFPPPQVLDTK